MPNPKKRHTSTRSGNRRSHLAVKPVSLAECPKCKEKVLAHVVCPNCGYYNGNDVLKIAQKEKEKLERRKQREQENE